MMILTLVLLVSPVAAGATEPRPLADQFPLGVYWPWERTAGLARRNGLDKWPFVERCLDDLKRDGFDSVWAVNLGIPDLPGLAERMAARGMKLVPALGELHYNIPWRRNNWTYLEKASRQALSAAGGSPSILAWALCDEPRRDLVGEMETFRQKFAQWGARQPGVVVTMWPDSPTYAKDARFEVICTDVYPFFSLKNPNGPNTPGGSRAWYRRQARMTVEAARGAGRTPWIMPQCFVDVWGPWKYDDRGDAVMLPGAVLHWRQPTIGETRWQVWSALGLGIQGFFWYVYLPPPQDQPEKKAYAGPAFPPTFAVKESASGHGPGGMLYPNGSPTPEYLAAAQVFQTVRPLLPIFVGALSAEREPPTKIAAPGWIGWLHNPKLKRALAVVVNDDTDRPQALTVSWPRAQARDLCTGKLLETAADHTITLTLEPGGGTVLE